MNASSSAYVTCVYGEKPYTWHFTGVTAIEHSLTLNLESASSEGADIINGARNQPDRVSMSVVETDAEHSPGWSARMLEAMASLKKNRVLCRVATSMGAYSNMLLGEIAATQDQENQCGWKGTLSFVEYVPAAEGGGSSAKARDNSSTRANTGSGTCVKVAGDALEQLLLRAGVVG